MEGDGCESRSSRKAPKADQKPEEGLTVFNVESSSSLATTHTRSSIMSPKISFLSKDMNQVRRQHALCGKFAHFLGPLNLDPGCGRHIEPVGTELRNFIRSTGMKLEALDSGNALSAYCILNEEGKFVVAALLPYGVSSSTLLLRIFRHGGSIASEQELTDTKCLSDLHTAVGKLRFYPWLKLNDWL